MCVPPGRASPRSLSAGAARAGRPDLARPGIRRTRSRTARRTDRATDGPLSDVRATRVRPVNDRLVWVDCEMTGLSVRTDKLIEIAALVTDSDLNILGDGIDVVIHADDEALAGMPEVVVAMHDEVRADRAGPGVDGHPGAGRADGARLRPRARPGAEHRTAVRATPSPPTAGSSAATCRRWTTTCTTG